LIYQGLEEENLDQKLTWSSRLGVVAAGQLLAHQKNAKKNQTPSLGNQKRNGVWFPEDGDSC